MDHHPWFSMWLWIEGITEFWHDFFALHQGYETSKHPPSVPVQYLLGCIVMLCLMDDVTVFTEDWAVQGWAKLTYGCSIASASGCSWWYQPPSGEGYWNPKVSQDSQAYCLVSKAYAHVFCRCGVDFWSAPELMNFQIYAQLFSKAPLEILPWNLNHLTTVYHCQKAHLKSSTWCIHS